MKKLFKVGTIVMLGVVLLAGCAEVEEPTPTGKKEVAPKGERKGEYYFGVDDGLESKVLEDKDGCIFLVTTYEGGTNRDSATYGLDVEFMGGCDFPSLYSDE